MVIFWFLKIISCSELSPKIEARSIESQENTRVFDLSSFFLNLSYRISKERKKSKAKSQIFEYYKQTNTKNNGKSSNLSSLHLSYTSNYKWRRYSLSLQNHNQKRFYYFLAKSANYFSSIFYIHELNVLSYLSNFYF